MTANNGEKDVAQAVAALPRCGRCASWTGHRTRNSSDATTGFAINGRCSNADAPPELSGRQVHYMDGAGCPQFKNWKVPSRRTGDGDQPIQ